MPQTYPLQAFWLLILRELDILPANLLARAGLPADLLARSSASVTALEYARLWEALDDEAGDQDLALEIGRMGAAEAFSPPIVAALTSPDLNTAAQRLSRFKKILGPFRLDVDIDSNRTMLTLRSIGMDLPALLGLSEVVFFVEFVRRATRAHVVPQQIWVKGVPTSVQAYEEALGVRLRKSDAYALSFSAQDARRPFLTADAQAWTFYEPVLTQRLAEIDHDAKTAERVHAALVEMLPSGRHSVEDVSGTLGMSARSLQRHLKQEGTSFQETLARTRERLARHYLRVSEMTTAEIALLLGYDDPNSFFRAFRAWTGQTQERLRGSASRMVERKAIPRGSGFPHNAPGCRLTVT